MMNIAQIIRTLCANAWRTSPAEMSTACRKWNVVDAKQAETFLMSQVFGMKSSRIFREVGDKRHRSTYRYRRIAAQNKIETDNSFKVKVDLIRQYITSAGHCPQ